MITLKLTPGEFLSMVHFLKITCAGLDRVALEHRPLRSMILADYLATISQNRVTTWAMRKASKTYTLSLKLTVARALYDELQAYRPTNFEQQGVLDKLNLAFVDFKPLRWALAGNQP